MNCFGFSHVACVTCGDNAHYQYTQGLLNADEWDGFRENLKLLLQLPVYRDYWDRFQVMFSTHFRHELNSLLGDAQPFDIQEALGKTTAEPTTDRQ